MISGGKGAALELDLHGLISSQHQAFYQDMEQGRTDDLVDLVEGRWCDRTFVHVTTFRLPDLFRAE